MLKSETARVNDGSQLTPLSSAEETPGLLMPDSIIKIIRKKVIDLARQDLREKCKPYLHRPTAEPYDSDEDMPIEDDFQGVVDFMLFYKEKAPNGLDNSA